LSQFAISISQSRFCKFFTGLFITLLTFSFVGALVKILSAVQNETEMAGAFERHQIVNTQDKPL